VEFPPQRENYRDSDGMKSERKLKVRETRDYEALTLTVLGENWGMATSKNLKEKQHPEGKDRGLAGTKGGHIREER